MYTIDTVKENRKEKTMLYVVMEIAKAVVFSTFEVATVLLIVGLIMEVRDDLRGVSTTPNVRKFVRRVGR